MVYRILLNDGMDKEGIELFKDAGIETDKNKRDKEALVRDIRNFDALVVRSATKATKDVIEAGVKDNGLLKIIGRAGVGVDNIDVVAASEHGVVVKYAPHGNTNAAAELTLELMLNVSRNVAQAHHSLKNGIWLKKQFEGNELSNKTLGIIGCGRIGQRLSELVSGLNMEVIGYDKNIEDVKSRFPHSRIKYVPKEEVIAQADYISIHTGGKELVIGAKEISLTKPTAYLINVSRGDNVDEDALYAALTSKRIAGAALDVYKEEPKEEKAEFKNKLRELDNVVMSSHLGASTKEAQIKTSIEMARVVTDYLLKGDFSNSVNVGESIRTEERPVYSLFVHHRDVPGAFAKINEVLARNNINIRETPSRQIGKDNAIAVYLVHQKPSPEVLSELEKLDVVLRVRV